MPLMQTTRQHAHFQFDLMNRYFEKLVTEARHKEDTDMVSSQNTQVAGEANDAGKRNVCNRYIPSTQPFFLVKTPKHGWHTHLKDPTCGPSCGELYHPHKKDVEATSWLKTLCRSADVTSTLDGISGKEIRVICCYMECQLPTNREGVDHDILRCHPSYRTNFEKSTEPWHDWIMVRWECENCNNESESVVEYETAAKLLVWGEFVQLSEDGKTVIWRDMKCVVRSMEKEDPPDDPKLFFAKGDVLGKKLFVIDFDDVLGVAHVLPAVPPKIFYPKLAKEKCFPNNPEDVKYFVVLPERNKWPEIGWD